MTRCPPDALAAHLCDDGPPHRLTVRLRGLLDHTAAHELVALVALVSEALADRPDVTELVLCCAGVTQCDLDGVSALIAIRRRADAHGARLTLGERPAQVDRLLVRTGTAAYLGAVRHPGQALPKP
ncbi:STAS domain-containing protein [Streptomyces aureocirculatus]|uniref:STAS domain-containing protein n=1 Tax=Streptomyces aureocirculatus TaxID=67275 RepID=UPI0004C95DB4|nr:STAS domain-containing protein [Streptomyces aureocirculatus]